MITAHACIPCLTRQIVDSIERLADQDAGPSQVLLRSCLQQLATADFSQPPPVVAQGIQRHLRRIAVVDPYADLKQETRNWALDLLPALQAAVAEAADPLTMAVRFAAAGNLIDAGAVQRLGRAAVEQALARSREAPLDTEALDQLRQRITSAKRILYLADNAGELVFDRLLLEQLPRERLTLVVRGAPVLNDVTLEDLAPSGIPEDIQVLDTGSDCPGTFLDDCKPQMQQAFAQADLVISKGQGNFETLHGQQRPIFVIMTVKCPVIADLIGQAEGSIAARFIA